MASFDPFNAIIAKAEKPPVHALEGPLEGERLAVKDIYDVAGMVTGCGNPQIEAESPRAERSAPVVERLLAAGAEFVGKAQTDELAFSLMGQNSHFPIRSIRQRRTALPAAHPPARRRPLQASSPTLRSVRIRAAPFALLQASAVWWACAAPMAAFRSRASCRLRPRSIQSDGLRAT